MDKFLEKLLESRERRYYLQKEITDKFNLPIISFMINTPGIEKRNDNLVSFHNMGIKLIKDILGEKIIFEKYVDEDTGMYFLASVNIDGKALKEKMIELEESEMGRLFDIDVFDESFNQITRSSLNLNPRSCIICDKEAKLCIREQNHSYEDLVIKTQEIIEKYVKKY